MAVLELISLLSACLLAVKGNAPSTFTCTASSKDEPSPKNLYNASSCNCDYEEVKEVLKTIQANSKGIIKLQNSLSELQNKVLTTSGTLNNVLLFVEELLTMHNVSSSSPLPTSCLEIKNRMPTSPSGVYLIATSEKKTQYVYCYMEPLCSFDGGWTRIAHLNMSDLTVESCPGDLRLYSENEVRACGRPVSKGGSCSSLIFHSNGVTYSQLCGRVRGYQYATTDAVDHQPLGGSTHHNNINSYYVDGISLTRGNPRKHVWTFMSGVDEIRNDQYSCPCQKLSTQSTNIPSFIGNDYFCESGSPLISLSYTLFTADPLWDGKKCRTNESPCCTLKPSLPWFHKHLSTPSNEYIELRVCSDQDTENEDTAIDLYEIYVK